MVFLTDCHRNGKACSYGLEEPGWRPPNEEKLHRSKLCQESPKLKYRKPVQKKKKKTSDPLEP